VKRENLFRSPQGNKAQSLLWFFSALSASYHPMGCGEKYLQIRR
jgi:hypothetical protein